ncbi:MAG: response regulator [Lachnospiraceae bacterium]|nr:response regulator [Lachnospiraceae bacterium]MBR6256993.1 response regulator [Lachnospiraceae bacterium]
MLRVFLAEDEFVVREGIKKNIDWEAHGCEFCGEAADGETALERVSELKPDLIISDIRMPFMDGLTFCSRAKELFPDIRIILLTGYEEFEYARKAIDIGVERYLTKPISREELSSVLDDIAAKYRVNSDTVSSEQYREVIYSVFEYVEKHYSEEDLTLARIADHIGLSPNHLSAVFKEETGQSFTKYLTDHRIKLAKKLLDTSKKRSSEIAYLVGYPDPHYFSSVFKKQTGMTPSQYRDRKEGV